MILQIGRRKNNRPRIFLQDAYTLLELILVTLLLITMISISAPILKKTYEGLLLRYSADTLGRVVNFAQQRAILEERSVKLVFDFDNRTYWLMQEVAFDGGQTEGENESQKKVKGFVRLTGWLKKRFFVPGSISMEGDKRQIIFYPDGHSDKAQITFKNKLGKVRVVFITGRLGNVRFQTDIY